MKAVSVGLECDVEISEEELRKVKSETLESVLIFYPVGFGDKKEIPFSLQYDSNQKEDIEYSVFPKETYFGEAKFVNFVMGNYFYGRLVENKSYGCRFAGSGKLDVRVEGS